ncbi:MAG: hypothetical protein IPM34_00240 [Saprospiraceae bacterium]|nr:hypothetical protein [Saprospiraceae bacterium]
MFIVRDTFRLKFGMFKEASQTLKKAFEEKLFEPASFRILSDFTGDAYRLILEARFSSLSEYENAMFNEMQKPNWKNWYATFKPFVESSSREILKEIEM